MKYVRRNDGKGGSWGRGWSTAGIVQAQLLCTLVGPLSAQDVIFFKDQRVISVDVSIREIEKGAIQDHQEDGVSDFSPFDSSVEAEVSVPGVPGFSYGVASQTSEYIDNGVTGIGSTYAQADITSGPSIEVATASARSDCPVEFQVIAETLIQLDAFVSTTVAGDDPKCLAAFIDLTLVGEQDDILIFSAHACQGEEIPIFFSALLAPGCYVLEALVQSSAEVFQTEPYEDGLSYFSFVATFSEPPICQGDANGDTVVDPLDYGYVLARLGCLVGTGDAECDAADQNLDGLVDPLDAGYLQARFGDCSN